MNWEKVTNLVNKSISEAINLANKQKKNVSDYHLLLSLIENNDFFSTVIQIDENGKKEIEHNIESFPTTSEEIVFTNDLIKWFTEAVKVQNKLKDEFFSTEHLMLSMYETALKGYINKSYRQLRKEIMDIRNNTNADTSTSDSTYKVLEKYGRDLVLEAKSGKTDPIIGRDDEINSIIRILSRKTKNNPVLIGEPGVGKTAVIEGLAQRIVKNDVPDNLKNKKLIELSLSSLIAGAKYKGEFEERVESVLKEIKQSNGEIILFIDEIHTIVGAGKSEGSMDISNMLKPMLARGELKLVGATTLNEYRENIEKDGALERRFQKVMVAEPSIEDTISILRGLKERFEIFHGVEITDKSIIAAVELSTRYIGDRHLPDKAIDLIDEACSMIRAQTGSVPIELDAKIREKIKYQIELKSLKKENDEISKNRKFELKQIISDLEEEENEFLSKWNLQKSLLEKKTEAKKKLEKAKLDFDNAEANYDYEIMAKLKNSTMPLLENQLKVLEEKIKESKSLIDETVTVENIKSVIAKWTGIPLEKLNESQIEKLRNLKQYLSSRVIGQENAIEIVSSTILRSYAGINDPNKPLGSFMFLGPTGVGKTELVKALAQELFDDENSIIRIDMSEYMEKHNVSRLIGAPPGYVGYEQGGQLTEAVRRKPYSIVLLDEIEKAHTDVFNILLQILDEGTITDSLGNNINFKNTIIVMTSNIASNEILENKLSSTELDFKLREYFKPEILNRIDEIITFKALDGKVSELIINKFINQLNKRLEKIGTKIELTSSAIEKIKNDGVNNEYGARPIKRYIQKYIESELSIIILEQKFSEKIIVDVDQSKFIFK